MSMDAFENKLIDMRESYQKYSQGDTDRSEMEESVIDNYELIGVANVFLEVLYFDVKLTYAAPIISQHGKIKDILTNGCQSFYWIINSGSS